MRMNNLIRVAPISEIPANTLINYQLDEQDIIVYRQGETCYVYPNECTHKELPLADGYIINNMIVCRRHGAKFDLQTGECLRMPAEEDLQPYKTVLVDGVLYIEPSS